MGQHSYGIRCPMYSLLFLENVSIRLSAAKPNKSKACCAPTLP